MSCSVPCIVASQSFTAQSATFGPTTIYTPSANGWFRTSIYATTSDTNSNHGTAAKLIYTDPDLGVTPFATDAVIFGSTDGSSSYSAGTATFRAKASTNITLTTSITGAGTLATPYNVYVTIEAL